MGFCEVGNPLFCWGKRILLEHPNCKVRKSEKRRTSNSEKILAGPRSPSALGYPPLVSGRSGTRRGGGYSIFATTGFGAVSGSGISFSRPEFWFYLVLVMTPFGAEIIVFARFYKGILHFGVHFAILGQNDQERHQGTLWKQAFKPSAPKMTILSKMQKCQKYKMCSQGRVGLYAKMQKMQICIFCIFCINHVIWCNSG